MRENEIEPGLLRIFRYFSAIAVIYFLGFFVYTTVTTGTWVSANLIVYYINYFTYLFVFIYLSLNWLKNILKAYYLPIAIIVAGIVPIFSSLVLWPLAPESSLAEVIFRSWTLIPILIVPVVIIAWQYEYSTMIAYVIITFLYDLPFIVFSINEITLETIPALGVPLIRSFAFGTVGHIVHTLMETQRHQRRKLMSANIQLAEYANALEELATSRERNRLARELHDTLAHTLSGQIVTLEAIKLDLDQETDHQMIESVDQLLNNARTGLTETRRALKDLRSKQIEDLGLKIALTNLTRDAAARANAQSVITIQPDLPPLSHELEQCIFRIVQESLENVIRHANATQIELQFIIENQELCVRIKDNGVGFHSEDINQINSLGIQGMKERAKVFGGKLIISSEPAQGSKVEAFFEVNND